MAIRQRRREEPAVEYAFWGGYWDWEALRVKGVKAGLEIWFERVLEVIRRQSTEIRPRSPAPLKRRLMDISATAFRRFLPGCWDPD
jgi:hypothetical protein